MEANEELIKTLKEIESLDFTDKAKVQKYRTFVRKTLEKADNNDISNDKKAILILFLAKEMIHQNDRTYQPAIAFSKSSGKMAEAIKTVIFKENSAELNKNSRIYIYHDALGKRTAMGNHNIPQMVDLIHVVSHEYRHLIQEEQTLNGDMNLSSLKVTVDELYRRSLTVKEYHMNWKYMEFEKDAEIFGYRQVKKVLSKYSPQLLEKYEKEIDSIIQDIENLPSDKIKRISQDGTIVEVDKIEDRDEKIKRMILEDKKKIKRGYPQVFDVYNENGEKKTATEIQKLKEERIKSNPKQSMQIDKYFNDIVNEFKIERDTIEYNRSISSRDHDSVSETWENWESQDISKQHEDGVYHNNTDFERKILQYGADFETRSQEDYLGHIAYKMGQEYARDAKRTKAKIVKEFARLEVKGQFGDYIDPYVNEKVSGYNNPKLLLQLEEIKGLDIEELEDIIGLDTTQLKQKMLVATYEIKEWDLELNKEVYKPIKEYYQEDEYGELQMIGKQTEKMASFTIDGLEFDIKPSGINQKETIEKVTQKQLNDRLIKNGIEDSMKNGKVTEVAKITDMYFLRDFAKQCEVPENWNLDGITYIVSTINEKGEEDFDIIMKDEVDMKYEHLRGIEATEKSSRELYTTTNQKLSEGLNRVEHTKTLKEFVTKSGHRYAITRDSEGKLGLNEVFRENENVMQGKPVDTYTYSTDNLRQAYTSFKINQEDLMGAYKTISRTKGNREQTPITPTK